MALRIDHHEQHSDVQSLNSLAHNNAAITQADLVDILNNIMIAGANPQIDAFAPAMAQTPEDALRSPDFSVFAKYLYALRIPQDGDERLNRYFLYVFHTFFAQGNAPEQLRRRPTSPLYPIYFGIRTEIEDELHLNGRDLAEQTAAAFARFVVTATQNQQVPPSTGAGEVFRQDFRGVLSQFPFAQKLAGSHHLDEHTIEHELGNAKSEDLVALIAYLRTEITTERARGRGGIKIGEVAQVQAFLSLIEGLLAKKIAAKLTEGDNPEQGFLKIPNVVSGMLLRPLGANLHHGKAGMVNHLKQVKVEAAAEQNPAGHVDAGHTVGEAVHLLETIRLIGQGVKKAAGWLSRGEKEVKEVVPPTVKRRPPH